jgi:P-type E1-E2 ATPase
MRLEKFLEVDTLLFDKTGTLTYEDPEVSDVVALGAFTVEEIVRYAAIAEQKLAHPIAKAIVHKARELGVSFPDIDDSSYSIGYGTKVDCQGEIIQAGSLRYLEGEGLLISKRCRLLQDAQDASGRSHVFLAVNRKIIGALQLQPRLRSEIAEVVAHLRRQGIRYMAVVSGDRDAPTRLLADQLGMDGYFSSALPEQKAETVAMLQANGKKVCFVGDGINDSIALKQADVSISLAGANTIAKDMAEIIIMDGRFGSMARLHEISKTLDKNLRESLALSVAPGAINLLGAFLLDFNTLASLLVSGSFGIYGALRALPSKSPSALVSLPSYDAGQGEGEAVVRTSAA